MMHHKGCGGELYLKKWSNYGEEFGLLPDYYCRKCDSFITGDAQILETIDELQMQGFAPSEKDQALNFVSRLAKHGKPENKLDRSPLGADVRQAPTQ